jgi:hypothetical protein
MESSSGVQVISAAVGGVAAIVTAWMALETRRMAIATTRSFELNATPILGLKDVHVRVDSREHADISNGAQLHVHGISVGIELFNAGRVAAKYAVRDIQVTFDSRGVSSGTFRSRGGQVLPGGSAVFWHPLLRLDPPVSVLPAVGNVDFEVEYTDAAGSYKQRLAQRIEYTLNGAAPGSGVSWLLVDPPPAA